MASRPIGRMLGNLMLKMVESTRDASHRKPVVQTPLTVVMNVTAPGTAM